MALKRWIIYVSTGTITESQRLLLTYHQPVMLQKVIFRGHSMQPTHKSIAWETSLTKVMNTAEDNIAITIEGDILQQVDHFQYLGAMITVDGKCEADIRARLGMAKGVTMESQCLVSKKCHRNLPDEVSLKCNCVKCVTRSCPCTERNVRCCTFCKCQASSQCKQCKNPNGIILTK